MSQSERDFREHRSRAEVASLLRYGHIIPVSKGYTDAYVASHFPGWTWNQLMEVWRSAGIVVRTGGGMATCHHGVVSIAFNGPGDLQVEWADGTLTQQGPGDVSQK